jgi:hypothetical protein
MLYCKWKKVACYNLEWKIFEKASFCELDELDHHRAPAVPQEIECRAAIMAATSTSKVGSPIDMHPYAAQH